MVRKLKRCYKAYKKVGKINLDLFNEMGFDFDRTVYASPGVINHIIRHHAKQLTRNVKDNLVSVIKTIISDPDYITLDKVRGGITRIEFIKKIDSILLLGLEVDTENQYIYVATLYPITKNKLESRRYSGKLISYDQVAIEKNK